MELGKTTTYIGYLFPVSSVNAQGTPSRDKRDNEIDLVKQECPRTGIQTLPIDGDRKWMGARALNKHFQILKWVRARSAQRGDINRAPQRWSCQGYVAPVTGHQGDQFDIFSVLNGIRWARVEYCNE